MKKIPIFLISAVLVFGLCTLALATPIPGTYSTANGTLYPGFWYEWWPGGPGQMGKGGSTLTALSDESNPPGQQWKLSMTSEKAGPYTGGAPYGPSTASNWDWTTPYFGTITIGGSLTAEGVPFGFETKGTNYNVTYNTSTGDLEWLFVAHGTYDGYEMDVTAYYRGKAGYLGDPFPYFTFGDLVDNIQMAMVITGPAPVPEPATIMLLGSGLLGLVGIARKKFRK
ncbi:MAG: PEP-CTERM sorting domain-containing protein [Thermodesulfobacteriota bacterium]